jgi:hypothetical protein
LVLLATFLKTLNASIGKLKDIVKYFLWVRVIGKVVGVANDFFHFLSLLSEYILINPQNLINLLFVLNQPVATFLYATQKNTP